MTRLALEQVSFWYPATDLPALEDVSLEVGGGEIVALVGRVGAGASSVLLVAADLAPRVTGGRLRGRVALTGGRRGLVLASPWTQLSGMAFTVWDEVAFGPANLGWPRDEITQHVERALTRLGIAALRARDPATVSGGELARVMLAGILAMDPAVLLCDEPTGALDPVGAREVWRLLRALADEGRAVLVATSDLDAAAAAADRVVWLERGRVAGAGPRALLADEATCAAGLGTSVASVWRAAGLALPYPATVAEALARWR